MATFSPENIETWKELCAHQNTKNIKAQRSPRGPGSNSSPLTTHILTNEETEAHGVATSFLWVSDRLL
jgi:hypothetical protein